VLPPLLPGSSTLQPASEHPITTAKHKDKTVVKSFLCILTPPHSIFSIRFLQMKKIACFNRSLIVTHILRD
jgi:hypothetical protein